MQYKSTDMSPKSYVDQKIQLKLLEVSAGKNQNSKNISYESPYQKLSSQKKENSGLQPRLKVPSVRQFENSYRETEQSKVEGSILLKDKSNSILDNYQSLEIQRKKLLDKITKQHISCRGEDDEKSRPQSRQSSSAKKRGAKSEADNHPQRSSQKPSARQTQPPKIQENSSLSRLSKPARDHSSQRELLKNVSICNSSKVIKPEDKIKRSNSVHQPSQISKFDSVTKAP